MTTSGGTTTTTREGRRGERAQMFLQGQWPDRLPASFGARGSGSLDAKPDTVGILHGLDPCAPPSHASSLRPCTARSGQLLRGADSVSDRCHASLRSRGSVGR